ncbi:MAG: MOSC domain-containing protein [Deltaproteobacteria bacterium]|nr:MOSC domain-containing protein [Deltaproteobacteria bacterium]
MRSFDELESLWCASPPAPRGSGTLRLIVLRKGDGVHETPATAEIDPEHGIVGDRWQLGSAPDPQGQVSLMNARAAELVADGGPLDLPGDNLVVDLDLGTEALPVGSRLRVGSALLEITPLPHTGCRKFSARFGQDALRWVNWKDHRDRHLRGINCRVLEAGTVRVGDACVVE